MLYESPKDIRQVALTANQSSVPQVALVTFGPGPVYWERFGHNAIVIDDSAAGTRVAYNYGVFDFQEKHFLLNFVLGQMHYSLDAEPLDDDVETYVAEGRSVTVQILRITPAQARQLAAFLAWNAQPQNADYQYDYFINNCSTKVRDALNRVLGGTLERQLVTRPAPHTYRFDAVRLISPDFWLGLGMDAGLGPKADSPLSLWQESFVPMVLSRALDAATVRDANGQTLPLVSDEEVVAPGTLPTAPAAPPTLRLPFLTAGVALAALLLWLAQGKSRLYRAAFGVLAVAWWLIFGITGLLLAGLWGVTDHWAAWQNENLLLLNPVCGASGTLVARTTDRSRSSRSHRRGCVDQCHCPHVARVVPRQSDICCSHGSGSLSAGRVGMASDWSGERHRPPGNSPRIRGAMLLPP
jgi:hypothetical protein